MKPFKVTNEIHARPGDVIVELEKGDLVVMPEATYEATRRDLRLPPVSDTPKRRTPRRTPKKMTPRLERVRNAVVELTDLNGGERVPATEIAALMNTPLNHITQILYNLNDLGAVTRQHICPNGREVYGYAPS